MSQIIYKTKQALPIESEEQMEILLVDFTSPDHHHFLFINLLV